MGFRVARAGASWQRLVLIGVLALATTNGHRAVARRELMGAKWGELPAEPDAHERHAFNAEKRERDYNVQARSDRELRMSDDHLNIVVVEDTAHMVVRKYTDDHQPTMVLPRRQWDGPLMIMLREISSSRWANFSYNITLPNRTTTNYTEAYHMVEQRVPVVDLDGKPWARPADVYWTPTTITPTRVAGAHMTSTYGQAPLALVVPTDRMTAGTMDRLFIWTKPFSGELWAYVIASHLFAGLVFLYVDSRSPDFEYHGVFFYDLLSNLGESMYLAVMTFTGGNTWTPSGMRGKLFSTAWAFFCLIMLACFTAELAALLGGGSATTSLSGMVTLKDYSEYQLKACVLQDTDYVSFLHSHLTLRFIALVPCRSYHDIIERLDRGDCQGTVLPEPAAKLLTDGGYTSCEDPRGTELVLSITDMLPYEGSTAMGFGMSLDMDQAVMTRLDYWISRYVSTGRVTEVYDVLAKRNGCAAAEVDTSKKSHGGLSIRDTGGVFLIVFATGAVCILLKLIEKLRWYHRLVLHGNLKEFVHWFHEHHSHLNLIHPDEIGGNDENAENAQEEVNHAILGEWLVRQEIRERLFIPIWMYIEANPLLATLNVYSIEWRNNHAILYEEWELRTRRGEQGLGTEEKSKSEDAILAMQSAILRAVLKSWWIKKRAKEDRLATHRLEREIYNVSEKVQDTLKTGFRKLEQKIPLRKTQAARRENVHIAKREVFGKYYKPWPSVQYSNFDGVRRVIHFQRGFGCVVPAPKGDDRLFVKFDSGSKHKYDLKALSNGKLRPYTGKLDDWVSPKQKFRASVRTVSTLLNLHAHPPKHVVQTHNPVAAMFDANQFDDNSMLGGIGSFEGTIGERKGGSVGEKRDEVGSRRGAQHFKKGTPQQEEARETEREKKDIQAAEDVDGSLVHSAQTRDGSSRAAMRMGRPATHATEEVERRPGEGGTGIATATKVASRLHHLSVRSRAQVKTKALLLAVAGAEAEQIAIAESSKSGVVRNPSLSMSAATRFAGLSRHAKVELKQEQLRRSRLNPYQRQELAAIAALQHKAQVAKKNVAERP